MRRIAWFTPLPPIHSGISRYSAELLPRLTPDYEIDVFVDARPESVESPSTEIAVRHAHDFVWMHFRRPYDLVVYQMGNARCHDYMWGYVARYPGLVVMHDGQLHHARGANLREHGRHDDYMDEFTFDHPGLDPAIADLAVNGRLGGAIFNWPMRRVVVESSRLLAVHNRWLAEQIAAEHPDGPVRAFEMGVPPSQPSPGAKQAVRARHGISDEAVLFVALGEVTPAKRIPQAIRQLAAVATQVPDARLLLAGSLAGHYDPMADARNWGVADRVHVTGYVAHDAIADYLEAADACLCLRWPTSRETSAAFLRCLAAGRPTVITDLVHTGDLPAYDPRGWTVLHTPATRNDAAGWPLPDEPACISIDLLDEEHSLQLAMHRLAVDPALRARLGREAHRVWQERYTLDGMVAAYRGLLVEACEAPLPARSSLAELPAHFRATGTEQAERLLSSIGLDAEAIAGLWAARPRAT